MKFSIPTNWQDDLLPRITNPEVSELYGKITSDFVGGGKHSFQVPSVSKHQVERHIKEVHRRGLKFNYLLNSACLDNLEWTRRGQRRIRSILDWVAGMGVGGVTVTIPYLAELIKKNYPGLKVYVSTLAGVDTLERARFWEDLGADRIILFNPDINRNFPLLRRMAQELRCELKLIANVNCLYHCPFHIYHGLLASHSSQCGHPTRGFVVDYCRIRCRSMLAASPREYIRSPWIRPEDVKLYEDIGIDYLKLIDRGMTTEWITRILQAYLDRRYDGNLVDLFPGPRKTIVFNGANLFHKFRYFFRPFTVNVFKFAGMRRLLAEPGVVIDNRALDGFIDFFLTHDCAGRACSECGYCDGVAARVVKIDPVEQAAAKERYGKCLSGLVSGDLFRY